MWFLLADGSPMFYGADRPIMGGIGKPELPPFDGTRGSDAATLSESQTDLKPSKRTFSSAAVGGTAANGSYKSASVVPPESSVTYHPPVLHLERDLTCI